MSLLGWLTLSLTDGLGPVLSGRLVDAIGNVDAAMSATPAMLRGIEGIGQTKASTIATSLTAARDEAKRELDRVAAAGVRLVCLDDECYPALMRSIHTPPMVLYVRGTLEPRDLHAVGIVGSRKCSLYGREQAERLGYGLANVGACVISGGARGIDTAAHVGALNARNGRTIAVLGCGVDRVYPPENAGLFERIVGNGAIVSEFPLGTPPVADNFPRRNRIISAMSRGVIVVEAEEKSGALITVKYATEHDRTVFAVPGRVDNPLSAGPHRLIRDGAVLVERVSDVLENLGAVQVKEDAATPTSLGQEEATLFVEPPPPPAPKPSFAPTDRQQLILDAIGSDVVDVDSICDRAALPVSQVMAEMTMLTLRGAVKRVDGDRYARKSPPR